MQATHRAGRSRRAIAALTLLTAIVAVPGSTLAADRDTVPVSTASFDRVAVRQAPDVRVLDTTLGVPPGAYVAGEDPTRLLVGYETTSCQPFDRADVDETDQRVEVHLRFRRVHERSYLVCHLRALVGTAAVELSEPLGGRSVVVTGSSTIPGPGAS